MKKFIIITSLFAMLLVLAACTVAPETDNSVSTRSKIAGLLTAKPTVEPTVKAELARPKKVTDKDITATQKILKAVATGKMKSADAEKKLDAMAKKVGHLGLAWIVNSLK
jgi:hypothetical protein